MTSNFGAVGFSQTDKNIQTTETDWTNPKEKGLSIYEKSKTLAEKAAWDFIKKEGEGGSAEEEGGSVFLLKSTIKFSLNYLETKLQLLYTYVTSKLKF